MNARDYLESILYTPEEVDAWLAGRAFLLEKYHGELGWLFRSGRIKDGIDGSICTYTFEDSGPRRMLMHRDQTCRINTYGDSFTQCHNVNDGETWQEMLAAHLGEPVRNYGIGGYSVYQSYLRMIREEHRTPAKYILFGIFTDDHFRSLPGWRNIRSRYTYEVRQRGLMGCSPTLPHVQANPATGEFVECPNPCPTPESVHNLCDLDWVYETFKDDLSLAIVVARANLEQNTPELSFDEIAALARSCGLDVTVDSRQTLADTLSSLHRSVAIYASMRIVGKVVEWSTGSGTRVLLVLSYPASDVARRIKQGTRFDQQFVDFLDERGLPYVDLLEAHAADFKRFNLDLEDYLKGYFIGHYNPQGNFFTACATKDAIVHMMSPKPPSYQLEGFPVDPQIAFDYGL